MSLTFEEQLAIAESEARTGFQRQLKSGYRGFAQQYARQTGRYPHPSVVEKWRRGETQEFEARLREWEAGAKAEYKAESEKALEEWRAGIVKQYPSDKYRVEWTDEGARIFEKVISAPLSPYIGYYPVLSKYGPRGPEYVWYPKETEKAYPLISRYGPHGPEYVYFTTPHPKKAILEYAEQFTRPTQQVAMPFSVARGFVKAQQYEAKQMLDQMQKPLYKPQTLGKPYREEKGKRRGVEVAPIEMIRERAYEHPEKVWKPPSLSETLLEFGKTEPIPHVGSTYLFGKPQITFEPVRPLAGIAGFVAYPETLVYAGMSWVGAEPFSQPPPPLKEGGQEYRLGYVTSMVVGSLFLTEAVAKTPIPKWEAKIWEKTIGGRAGAWLTKQYIEKGPMAWKGIPEKIVMGVTGAKPYLAPQVVSVPTPEVLSYPTLEAQATAWGLAETPKTSALLVSKMPGERLAKAWVTEHLFKTAMGGLSYALVEEQMRKTVSPEMPYIPKEIYGTKTLRSFFPVVSPVVTPKPSVTMKPTEIVEPKVVSVPNIKEMLKPSHVPKAIPTFASIQVSKVSQKEILKQVQIPKQVQVQKVTLQQIQQTMLEPPRTITKVLDISEPKRKRRRRKKGRSPFMLYEEFVYPVATAKQFFRKVVK